MNGKAAILARIDRALRDRPEPGPIPRDYRHAGTSTDLDLVELFEGRLGEYGARVRRCKADAVPAAIGAALSDRGNPRMLVPDAVPSGWLLEGIVDRPSLSNAELDRVDGVLTTCALAIAQTGTIVLNHDPGQGRRAVTLVPDYHLVVVRVAQIVASVPDAICALDPCRPMTWISGPSATSDIELSRVEGVHGPRQLEVVIVSAEAG